MAISEQLFYALILLNLLFVAGAWCLARPSLPAAAVLTVVAVAWSRFNGPIEGRVLMSFTSEHGVTESDLLSVLAVVIAAAGVWRVRRAR